MPLGRASVPFPQRWRVAHGIPTLARGNEENRLETLACQIIFQLAQDQQLEIVWSFMLAYENSLNPFIERRLEIGYYPNYPDE